MLLHNLAMPFPEPTTQKWTIPRAETVFGLSITGIPIDFLNSHKLLFPPWLSVNMPFPSLQPLSLLTPETSTEDILTASTTFQWFYQS